MMPDWLADAGGAAWAIVGILGAAFGILMAVRTGWRPFRSALDWTETLNELVTTQREINEVVKRELMPNGGGSLKDQVCRIDKRLTDGEARFASIEERLP